MTTVKKALRMLLRLAALYVISALISIFAPNAFLLRHCSTLFLMALSLTLMMYFSEHIIDPDARRALAAIAGLIVLWVLLRGAKYIAFEETGVVARHIWYCYYIPALLIPLVSLLAAFSVGKREKREYPALLCTTVCFTVLLILLFLTNDLHQLAFRFQPAFADWDAEYARGPVFAVACIWIAVLFVGVFGVLYSRCRLSASRKLVWIPMLPVLFGVVYLPLYAMDAWININGAQFGEFPETVCFIMAGVWLSLIHIGLIPSNEGYGRLFELSDLAAQISDSDYRVIYRNANAMELTREQMASSADMSLDRDTRVHRKSVAGGFVYWQDDVTQLNRINEQLWEVGEQLAEESEYLKLRNELKEERAKIEAKTKAYDEVAGKVLPQSRRIMELCVEAGHDRERYAPNMKEICLLAVFIKRYANLSLLAAEQSELDIGELSLAVQESLRYVRELGVPADEAFFGHLQLPAQTVIRAYALFEALLEEALPGLRGLQAQVHEDRMKLTIDGVELSGPEEGGAEVSAEDHVTYVTVPLRRAGEPA